MKNLSSHRGENSNFMLGNYVSKELSKSELYWAIIIKPFHGLSSYFQNTSAKH